MRHPSSPTVPQGVLALLSGFNEHLFYAVYAPLGDVWDILVLVNSAVNFVVYCTMNRRFRHTVVDCFGLGALFRDAASGVSGYDGAACTEGRPAGTQVPGGRVVQLRTTTTAAAAGDDARGDGDGRRVTLAVYAAVETRQSLELQPSAV